MLLNEYVRELLEAAVAPEAAAQQGLALLVKSGTYYTLYNADGLLEFAKDKEVLSRDEIEPFVVAHFSVENTPGGSNPCLGAKSIGVASALKGYGPMMYDIIMSDSPQGLAPDRGEVSGDAERIWHYYANNRSDIEKTPFDDANNPHTPPKEDDCFIHGVEPETTPLDYAYKGANINYSGLVSNHEEFINNLGWDLSHEIHRAGLKFSWEKLGF